MQVPSIQSMYRGWFMFDKFKSFLYYTHTIHVCYISVHLVDFYGKRVNVGKYIIHGTYGYLMGYVYIVYNTYILIYIYMMSICTLPKNWLEHLSLPFFDRIFMKTWHDRIHPATWNLEKGIHQQKAGPLTLTHRFFEKKYPLSRERNPYPTKKETQKWILWMAIC